MGRTGSRCFHHQIFNKMNREIKFRGKRLTDGNWIYGDFFRNRGLSFIASDGIAENPLATWRDYNVAPETVGQFTGKYDKNGKEIYEGDIVKTKEYGKFLGDKNFSGYDHFEVHFKNGGFRLENEERIFNLTNNSHLEVVGNVHDNPSLLKGGEE